MLKIDDLKEVFELATSAGSFINELMKIKSNCKTKVSDKPEAKIKTSGNYAQVASSGNSAQVASSGYSAQVASSGNSAQVASSGYSAQVASSGNSAQVASSGNSAQVASSGYSAQVASSGNSARVASSGNSARVASSGNYAQVASSGYSAQVASSGNSARVASSGNSARVASSGNYAQVASSGNSARVASSGNSARVASSGNSARVASSGNSARVASSGNYARVASSGNYAQVASSGNSAQVASSGNSAQVASSGNSAVVAAIGICSTACAKKGSWITLAEYKKDENDTYIVDFVKTEQVDGEKIKEDVFYALHNKQFHEVEEIDGVKTIVLSKKKNVWKTKILTDDKESFVFVKDNVYAHGKTVKQAYRDWLFKTSPRDMSEYEGLKLTDTKDLNYWVICYRTITGACSLGTENYLEQFEKLLKPQMTLQEVIEATNGQYGAQTFREFFER